jgi:hypothetical protein
MTCIKNDIAQQEFKIQEAVEALDVHKEDIKFSIQLLEEIGGFKEEEDISVEPEPEKTQTVKGRQHQQPPSEIAIYDRKKKHNTKKLAMYSASKAMIIRKIIVYYVAHYLNTCMAIH